MRSAIMTQIVSIENGIRMMHTKPSHERSHAPKTTIHGEVRYLDATVLKRPFDPPRFVIAVCVVGAVAAALIGGFAASKSIDQILHGAERSAATVESNINRGVSYDLPVLQDYINMDDASIAAALQNSGYTTIDLLSEGEEGFDVMKLPSDVAVDDAMVAFAGGIGKMDAVRASRYLVGSWRFSTERDEGVSMRVRYADLQSADAGQAIQAALESEGWAENNAVAISDEGIDEVGNTYKEGTIQTDSGTYNWRISACLLADVYNIPGLPESAQYVGIRMQQ